MPGFRRLGFLNYIDREDVAQYGDRRKVERNEATVAQNRFGQPSDDQNKGRQPQGYADLPFIHGSLLAGRGNYRPALASTSIIRPLKKGIPLAGWATTVRGSSTGIWALGQRMPDEAGLIQRITRAIPSIEMTKGSRRAVPIGIGDDAMVARSARKKDWIISVDAFVQGVHFLVEAHPPESVGYKALARAASDLAAMGAKPRFFLLAMALPSTRTGGWLDKVLAGMGRAARELELELAGGDTTESATISMTITVIGEAPRDTVLRRSGARPGDILYVSRALGAAQLGLELVRRGLGNDRRLRGLLKPHLYPAIQIELGMWLAGNGVASAMMDISDGLSSDLPRLCMASGVAARIFERRIPCAKIPPQFAKRFGHDFGDGLRMALNGGDDYALLFTVPERHERKLPRAPGFSALRAIGKIQRGGGVWLIDKEGKSRPLQAMGWDPFRNKRTG